MRIAAKIHVVPAQCPCLLGANPDQQAQHDVGVHERGRPTHILQTAGPDVTAVLVGSRVWGTTASPAPRARSRLSWLAAC